MSTLKVDAIRHNSATSDAITTASDGTCTAKLTSIGGGGLSHRNIVINGAFRIAQRATSSTSTGYATVDRFQVSGSGADENPTSSQHTLTSSDTGPWEEGFRYSYHIQNGNQTGGAGASDYVQPETRLEAQDLANCGWNYTSSSSYITLSFWVKSSVAGDYTLNFGTQDGTGYRYLMEYTLAANTWTKITKTIPGNSNLTVNNDNGHGATIMWYPFLGSSFIQADQENNWYASSNQKYGTVSTTNWWTTNDATWEMTGVQLEVGDTATSFEHRSYGEELMRCMRYYEKQSVDDGNGGYATVCMGYRANSTRVVIQPVFRVPKRATNADFQFNGPMRLYYQNNSSEQVIDSWTTFQNSQFGLYGGYKVLDRSGGVGGSDGYTFRMEGNGNTSAYIAFSSEL